ncbi:RtcB family protein [Burkholderia cepacia]|uniref:tRNA-splicing ligase RtcB n=1 Tax=Burkholderia cepacia TaxID=292 RepID=A0AAX2RVB4_BURCE|nr:MULTISPECIES: RtcB family protein [Burkholderia]MCR5891716.1 RNA-splicing ligase RtcB [Burkholderia sp. HAN2018]TES75791.1 RtcB family protein [Burkholderia cepacia]TEU38977.1 RtcB family protein [Burkholderia cepacia]TEU54055.1 RtcB family protein [Burkholderia cepacia]TEU57842.1 RtcB family protein [Burkholderia cepacia]
MEITLLERHDEFEWHIPVRHGMRVPGIIYGDRRLIQAMDDKVLEQIRNVARLPGIVGASYAMPDAHWGYGFPIGGVAAFDAHAGGVGFDISCGVRTLLTGLTHERVEPLKVRLADALFAHIPAGVGSTGAMRLSASKMDDMLTGGAAWAVDQGYGNRDDLGRIEENGRILHAKPGAVSDLAKKRQRDEMGTLGSGNHYLEVQEITEIFEPRIATAFGLQQGQVVVTIHCGSRGLGHQIGTEYLREMVIAAKAYGIDLPDRELACAPIASDLGERYLGAMRAATNCALANRQILTHRTREVFATVFPDAVLTLLYDVSHNTCKEESHRVDGRERMLFVHRKGATRAFGPGHPALPERLRETGQPVLVGGSMGTASYILAGAHTGDTERAFGSACHGAGRAMRRTEATRRWHGRALINALAERGIEVRSLSDRGVAEEAPGAYKDVDAVVDAAAAAGLARKVARVVPIACIKG